MNMMYIIDAVFILCVKLYNCASVLVLIEATLLYFTLLYWRVVKKRKAAGSDNITAENVFMMIRL